MSGNARTVRTLLPMAYDGLGPSATCVNLVSAMHGDDLRCFVHVDRNRAPITAVPYAPAVPSWLSFLPYPYIQGLASRRTEHRYLRLAREGEVAYLWPAVSVETHRKVHERGIPIVLEGINTRMRAARAVLDEAYESIGAAPAHDITDQRIEEEEEKLSLASLFFAPSPGVEEALSDSPLHPSKIVSSSYGTSITQFAPAHTRRPNARCKVLFVGSVCVRKGVHHLLDAWEQADLDAELILAGGVEDAIANRCARQLARADVRVCGHVTDVRALYQEADVFVLPSLEEGDPLVTYEAAAAGLPIIASPMGATRMGHAEQCVRLVAPGDVDDLAEAMHELVSNPDVRSEWADRAVRAIGSYSWEAVGRARAEALVARLG